MLAGEFLGGTEPSGNWRTWLEVGDSDYRQGKRRVVSNTLEFRY